MTKKLTLEIVRDRLNNINPNIKILSKEYVNSRDKLSCKCLIDNHEWNVTWGSLSQGSGCPKCAGKLLSIDDIKLMVNKINPNIKILSDEYVSAISHLECQCLVDGYKWDVSWNNLQGGKGCPKCGGNTKRTLNNMREDLRNISPNVEIISENYTNARTPIKCRCLIDGYEWKAAWSSLFQGHGCPMCAGQAPLSINEIKTALKTINPNIKILSKEYVNNRTSLKCKCLIDGYEWNASWGNLSKGHGCHKCVGMARIDIVGVRDTLKKVNPNIEVLSDEYVNAHTHLQCRCKIDGHEWDVTWDSLIHSESGCPKCSSSKGESAISTILLFNQVEHEIQHSFNDCRNTLPLYFDFIVKKENTILFLIEYDGRHHFEPVNFGGISDEDANINFRRQQYNDNIKTQYCKDNNIPLLRIPYWEFDNIETILHSWLIKYKLTK